MLLWYLGIIASDLAEFVSLTKELTLYLVVSMYYRDTTRIEVYLSTYGSLVKWLRHCPFTAGTASSNLPRITSRGFPTLLLPDLLLVPQLGAFRYFQIYVVFSSFPCMCLCRADARQYAGILVSLDKDVSASLTARCLAFSIGMKSPWHSYPSSK